MQVEEFVIERPCRERGVVIGGGLVMARFKWLDGPPGFMTKYAAKKPMQDYKAKDFKEQFKILKRERRRASGITDSNFRS